MASSASSLHYLSLTHQTLSLSKPNTSFYSLSFPFSSSLLKLSLSSTSSKPFFESSSFVRNVAVSSEFDQIEDVFDSEEDEGETNYSPDAKLFVGNLPFSVDSAALAGLFERAGSVEMVEVIYDKVTGRSRGFAFVTMSTTQEAEAAAQQFNGYELDGRALRVNLGPPPPKRESSSFRGGRESSSFRGGRESSSFRGGRESSSFRGARQSSSFRGARGGSSNFGGGSSNFGNNNRVYVGNLSWGVDDRALETLFSEQGRVMEAKVVYDRESGRSRGFGFVTYSSANEVNGAIEALDGVDLDGRSIRVSAAEARQRREF